MFGFVGLTHSVQKILVAGFKLGNKTPRPIKERVLEHPSDFNLVENNIMDLQQI